MILLTGIASEPPLTLVRDALDGLGAPYVLFHQRDVAAARIAFELEGGRIAGRLRLKDGRSHELAAFDAVYVRLMDDRTLPELAREPEGSPARRHARGFHETLTRWIDIMPGRVVNRTAAMASNGSKPYQAQLIRAHGLSVPETLVTSRPEAVREFRHRHGRIVYKSISGIRSIVQTVRDEDEARLDRIRWCPTQFQAYVKGEDVRVHVVGAIAFATAIASNVTDYRYAGRTDGGAAELRAVELDEDLAARCVRLAASLGLAFAGIDLKVTPDGEVYCFEVNPCPAYSFYELSTGQKISTALAAWLAHRKDAVPSAPPSRWASG
jgi:hypothetical protein